MIMKKQLLFSLTMILTVLGSYLPVYANSIPTFKPQSQQIVQSQVNCNNPRSDIEVRACIRLRYEAADQRLNQVYQQIIPTLSSEEKDLLVEAQRGWIQLRDNNCEFEVYRNRAGTGYRGFLNECLERMTKQRTAELENYLQQR
jgi:uncharacterized protein YecT (DUF1311 family)